MSRKQISRLQPPRGRREGVADVLLGQLPVGVRAADVGRGRLARVDVLLAEHLGHAERIAPARDADRAQVRDRLLDVREAVVNALAAAPIGEPEGPGDIGDVGQEEFVEHLGRDRFALLRLDPHPAVCPPRRFAVRRGLGQVRDEPVAAGARHPGVGVAVEQALTFEPREMRHAVVADHLHDRVDQSRACRRPRRAGCRCRSA